MADENQLALLRRGVELWNAWRAENKAAQIDLTQASLSGVDLAWADLNMANLSHADGRGANLNRANLDHADLFKADLTGANLSRANLNEADLGGANLSEASLIATDLIGANLNRANLSGADVRGALLSGANLSKADLSEANLVEANLMGAALIGTNLAGADLTDCKVYGIAVWNVNIEGAIQKDIVITYFDEPKITVDNLEVAQFIHLLLNNEKIRDVIDTITSKMVFILGRFTDERKAVLDAIRQRLRLLNYSPVLFDFERPISRNLTETMRTLAHLSRFIIADISEAKSVPQELGDIVPKLKVPFVPVLHEGDRPWGMFRDIKEYPWVLAVHKYREVEQLLDSLEQQLIPAAQAKAKEIEEQRRCDDEQGHLHSRPRHIVRP